MNIFVSILQVLLGAWNVIGGIYMSTNYPALVTTSAFDFFPSYFWVILAVVEIIFGLLLVVSVAKKMKKFAPVSAFILAAIAIGGTGYYVAYEGFPGMLWGIIPGIALIFVGCYRLARK